MERLVDRESLLIHNKLPLCLPYKDRTWKKGFEVSYLNTLYKLILDNNGWNLSKIIKLAKLISSSPVQAAQLYGQSPLYTSLACLLHRSANSLNR